tara:strand:+ start:330 stop:617 length:288 start_codon:yes stop_codon:yes gene_type:complete
MSGKICIKDIDLRKLVEELWKNAEYSLFSNQGENRPEFDWKLAIKQIKPGGLLEHICGKVLKVIINKEYIEHSNYDRLYGNGKVQEIIDNIKQFN